MIGSKIELNGTVYPHQWRISPIRDLCEFIVDCLHETPQISDTPTGYLMVRTSDLDKGRINLETARHVTRAVYERRTQRGVPQEGDIFISREAPMGEIGQVPQGVKLCLGQRTIHYRPNRNIVDSRFLKYALLSPAVQHEFSANKGAGSVVDNLRMEKARNLPVPLPPLAEQRAIAHILGSLDDKTELNRRMNATLEATARALFQSWFVDFDPVHAKVRGEQPAGMDAATAALFPDSFEESALGLIPKGWRVEPIGTHVKATKGLSYKGDYLADAGVPMHNLNSVYEGGGYKDDGIKFYSGEYRESNRIKPGELIVTNTEQGHDLLLIGYPALIPQRYPEGIYTHHLYKISPKTQSQITILYLYYLLLTPKMHDIVGGYANGTTVNMLPSDAFEKPRILIPTKQVLDAFQVFVQPVIDRLEWNNEESRTLAETRDALLPKLVSGEVRVPHP